MDSGFPSSSRSAKSGARRPFGICAPWNLELPPEDTVASGSSRPRAIRTRPPSEKTHSSTRAMSTRGFTRLKVVSYAVAEGAARASAGRAPEPSLRLNQAAADGVADQLHAIPHPQLGQHVRAVGL